MKKHVDCRFFRLVAVLAAICLLAAAIPVLQAAAEPGEYTVVRGDSLWKIAVRYKIGLDELIAANPQIKNPDLIYPGDVITIPQSDPEASAFEAEVVRLVNIRRAEYGLAGLESDWQLARVARYKSQDMAAKGYFSHNSPTYGSPFDMMKAFGLNYRFAGENIAMGQRTPAEVVNAWMNSAGHRANILNSAYRRIGVGFCPQGNYWTQMFIG